MNALMDDSKESVLTDEQLNRITQDTVVQNKGLIKALAISLESKK